MIIFRLKLILIFMINISIYGVDLNDHLINFEENIPDTYNKPNTYPKSDTGQMLFENDEKPNIDYNLYQYYDTTLEGKDQLIKFNDNNDFQIDYEDADNNNQNRNKQIIFKDDRKDSNEVKNPVKFESSNDRENYEATDADTELVSGRVAFVDDNNNGDQKPGQKKKKKRRRRPKYQSYGLINPGLDPNGNFGPNAPNANLPGPINHPNTGYGFLHQNTGYPNVGNSGAVNFGPEYPNPVHNLHPGYPGEGNPGYGSGLEHVQGFHGSGDPYLQNYGLNQPGLYQSGLQGNYRRPRRPKSLATKTLSALSEALTLIATNDDYQCVPRLLCEAAGGRASGSSSLLQSVAGLEPLLSVLSAYNGISTSPLFVFGRAVFLGMTSKSNTASCRYAYPQCPRDPDKLIHYLNNHNGGFFRFFNSPIPQQNQNVEQFYNQLAGQYGLHQPNGNQQDLQQNQYDSQNQYLYGNSQNYGTKYGYKQNRYGFDQNNYYGKDKIENRIQNKPIAETIDDDNSKWLFPDDLRTNNDLNYEVEPVRGSKSVKFPNENDSDVVIEKDQFRKGKGVLFPDTFRESYTRIIRNYASTTPVSLDDYVFDNKYNFYVKRPKAEKQGVKEDVGVNTLYIVRGNGDPNHPEIVKIKPGKY